jgi:hypothetical protein
MVPTASSDYNSPPARVAAFLRDFLPEQNLQLLFPLGSFLLLLGNRHLWFGLDWRGITDRFHPEFGIDHRLLEQLMHSIAMWVSLEEQLAHVFVQFGFLASMLLWVLAVRRPLRKFLYFVLLPVAAAFVGYQTYLIVTANYRNALLDAFLRAANLLVPASRSWLPSPSYGFHLTLAGEGLLVFALVLVRQRKMSLPLHFRGVVGMQPAGEADWKKMYLFSCSPWRLGALRSRFLLSCWRQGKEPFVFRNNFNDSAFESGGCQR